MRQIFYLFLVSFVLGSCTSKNKLPYGLQYNDTFRMALNADPPSMDWNKMTDTVSAMMVTQLHAGLTSYDLNDPELKAVPELAESWTTSKNGQVWTFKLKQGIKWTDGVEFEAKQVLDGWERLLNPATASEYSYFLFKLKNAKEYNEGKIKDFSQVGVKVLDKYKIEIELIAPISFLPILLTHHSTFPIRKDLTDKYGDKWTKPENMATLGAYRLKNWDHNAAVVLERNDGYYGTKANVKNLLFYIVPDQSTSQNLFQRGEVDFIEELLSTDVPLMRSKPEFVEKPILAIYYYGFNIKKKPFDNVNARKAIVYAIDRKEITDMIAGGQVPLMGWVPAGMFGHEDNMGLKFDPAKAKEYLAKAGYSDPSKFPRVALSFNTNQNHQRIAENVQAQIKRNLGIEIELKNEEWKVYLKTLQVDAPNIFRMGWSVDYPDPDDFMNLMTGDSANNHTGWKNKKYDDLIIRGRSEMNRAKRKAIYDEAQKLLIEEEVPSFPVYTNVDHFLLSTRVQNFNFNALRLYDLKRISLK